MDHNLIQRLQRPAETRIVMLIIEGLGGLAAWVGELNGA